LEQHQKDLCGLRSAKIADGKLTLVLNNTLAAVEDGRQEILRFIGPVDAMVLNRLQTIFEELVSNTIRHGFAKKSSQSIRVLIERKPDAVQLTFEDDGIAFSPLAAKPPERARTIETAQIGGLGIPLIVKLSSRLEYEQLQPANSGGFRPRNRTTVSVAI
jgi:anti-sigma regulatory factor (Ser/Thr protein kinase)